MNAIGLDSIDQDSENSAQHAMLGALLLGQRDPAFGEVYESFQRVGVAHVLAISGFHLALVIMLGVLFLRFVGEFPKCEALIIIAILFMGVLVVPMRPPIVRAGIIVIAFMLSGHAGRRYDRLTILAWVGAGLLLWRPLDVYSLGYQLSMGITALLILLTNEQEHIALNRSTFSLSTPKNARTPTGLLHRALLSIWGTAKTNIACWIVATPTIMYHAGIVSFLSPIISLVLIPMVIVLMVLGYAQIGIGLISPELSQHTIGVVEWVANIVRQFVVLVDSIPGSSIRVRSIDPILALVATGLLVAISIGYWKPRQRRVWVVLILLASWFVIAPIVTRERAALRIDMLDVGDGSCVLIQSDGEGIIWDCGSLDRRVGKMSSRAARRAGLGRISDAIVTHDNLDHFNGLIDLVPIVGIERVWVSERMIKNPSSTWSRFQTELESLGVQIVEINIHDRIRVGEIELECLWPDPDGIEGMSGNNTSIVVRIDVPIENDNERRGTRTILLSGDIEREAMDEIMRMNPDLRVDVLELPHHGSAKPGAFGFVRTIDPGVVMQSTGASRLDDPRWDELRSGRAWYTTARRGGLWVRIGRDGEITHGWAVE